MVKRKTQPKTKNKAGYAARTAEPVHDSTSDSTSASASERDNSKSDAEERETFRPPPKQSNQMETARNIPGTSGDKVQKKIVKPNAKKKGSALKVLKDIRLLQKTTNLLIPRAPFLRLVS
jgi:hypothetical protein